MNINRSKRDQIMTQSAVLKPSQWVPFPLLLVTIW